MDNSRSNKSSISSDSDSSVDGIKAESVDVQQKFDQANLRCSNSNVSTDTSTEERILAEKISTSKRFPNMIESATKGDKNDTSEFDRKSTTSSSECDSSSDSPQDPKTSLQLEQKQQSQNFDSDSTLDSYKELKNAIKVRIFHYIFRTISFNP